MAYKSILFINILKDQLSLRHLFIKKNFLFNFELISYKDKVNNIIRQDKNLIYNYHIYSS